MPIVMTRGRLRGVRVLFPLYRTTLGGFAPAPLFTLAPPRPALPGQDLRGAGCGVQPREETRNLGGRAGKTAPSGQPVSCICGTGRCTEGRVIITPAPSRPLCPSPCLLPASETPAAAGAGRGPAGRNVIDEFHLEVLERARRGDPVADLRGRRVQPLTRQRRDSL